MKWSLPDYTAPLNAEEIFNQMCGRKGLVVALLGNSGRVERNGMVESSVVHPHENDVDCNGSSVGCKESDVEGSREMSKARRVLSMEVLMSRLMSLTHSSNLLLSRGRSSLNTFNQEENWTSHPQPSSRSLILIRAMRVR